LLALLLLARLALPLALPWIVHLTTSGSGVEIRWQRLELSMLQGRLRVLGLELHATADAASGLMVRADDLLVDVAVTELLGGRFEIEDTRLSSALVRLPEPSSTASGQPAPSTDPASHPDRPPSSLRLPFVIRQLSLHDVWLLDPAESSSAEPQPWILDATVTDVGVVGTEAALQARMTSPDRLASLHLQAELMQEEALLEGKLALDIDGLRPRELDRWLAAAGIRPDCDRVDAEVAAELRAATEARAGALDVDARLQVDWRPGGSDPFRVASLQAKGRLMQGGEVRDASLTAQGVTARLRRNGDGVLCFAGIRFDPTATQPTAVVDPEPAAAASNLGVESIRFEGVHVAISDDQASPPLDLDVHVDTLDCGAFLVEHGAPKLDATRLAAAIRLPGIAEMVQLTGGELSLTDNAAELEATLNMTGLSLERVADHLAPLGIEPTLQNGSMSLQLTAGAKSGDDGALAMALDLRNVALRDGERTFSLPGLTVEDATFDAEQKALRIGRVAMHGAETEAALLASGSLQLPGARLHPRLRTRSSAAEPAATTGNDLQVYLQALELGIGSVRLEDRRLTPTVPLQLNGLTLAAQQLRLGRSERDRTPGRFSLRADVAEVVDGLRVDGQLMLENTRLLGRLELSADRVDLRPVSAYLTAYGIEPTAAVDDVGCALELELQRDTVALAGSLRLSDLTMRPEGQTEVSLASCELRRFWLAADDRHIEALRLRGLSLPIERSVAGRLSLAGVTFAPSAPDTGQDSEAASRPATQRGDAWLGITQVEACRVLWNDRSLPDAGELELSFAMRTDAAIRPGAAAKPVGIEITAAADGMLGSLRIRGSVTPDPDRLAADLTVVAEGIDGDAMRRHGIGPALTWRNAGLQCALQATAGTGKTRKLALTLRDATLHDGDLSLLAFETAEAHTTFHDSGAVDIDKLTLSGGQLRIEQTEQGMNIAGVRAGGGPGATQAADPAPPSPTPAVSPPDFSLEQLDLHLRELAFLDRTRPDAEPLRMDVRLTNRAAWHSAERDTAEAEPLRLQLTAAAEPLVGKLELDVDLRPLQRHPSLELRCDAQQVDLSALPRLLPPSPEGSPSSRLTRAGVSFDFRAQFDLQRESLLAFPFDQPFGLDLAIEDFDLRDDDDNSLLSLAALHAEASSIDLAQHKYSLWRLELLRPSLRMHRTASGLELAGFCWPLQSTPATVPTAPTTLAAKTDRAAGPELAVDTLLITGLGLDYVDSTTSPVLHLPVASFDLELEHYRTRSAASTQPMTFSAYLRGGPVDEPERTGAGGSRAPQFVDEIAVTGSIRTAPVWTGRVRADVRDLQLTALAGIANRGAVEIRSGTLDAGAAMQLRGSQGSDVVAQLSFRNLSLREPSNGPVSRLLRLPAPVETVVFALRNNDGAINIPLDFSVREAGWSTGMVTRRAVEALSLVIADALTSAPLRAARGFTGFLADLLWPDKDLNGLNRTVPFGSASDDLTDLPDGLDALVTAAKDDDELILVLEHVPGTEDMPLLAQRANPGPDEIRSLIQSLRSDRADRQRQRDALAVQARGRFAAGLLDEAEAEARQVRRLDDAIGRLQRSLDLIARQLQPGAERSADTRTNRAVVELGNARLGSIEQLLQQRLEGPSERQLEVRPARALEPEPGPGVVRISVRRRLANRDPFRRTPVSEQDLSTGFEDRFEQAFRYSADRPPQR
jgi:hypothetical protein